MIRALLLAAGLGTRLRPLTNQWPKCLMPIGDRPLLEYWLQILYENNIDKVIVNTHSHAHEVEDFLSRKIFSGWVKSVYEKELLGTAATLDFNMKYFQNQTTLLIHADNWCQCDFSKFINYHFTERPKDCLITMMTFDTDSPENCGIVEKNKLGIVVGFHEKVKNPPGNCANGAVYLLDPAVLDWLKNNPGVVDFSNDLLPNFLGRIATWHNGAVHRDIGTVHSLRVSQNDFAPPKLWTHHDEWQEKFKRMKQIIDGKYIADYGEYND